MPRGSPLSNQASPDALLLGDNALQIKRLRVPPLPPDIALAYRVNDAAEVSGLSRSTIYNLIAEEKLRSIVVAGRRLIPADALRELLQVA
jgi:excisionase family DNA binding protein